MTFFPIRRCAPARGNGGAAGRGPRRWAWRLALAAAGVLPLAGCSVLDKPARPAVYDFGPGVTAHSASSTAPAQAPLTLAEVEAAAALDSTALLYRLTYSNAQQLLPYAQARWSMTPAQLLRQRVRETLGQRRAVLNPGDTSLGLAQPALVLRIELEEFSHLFAAPDKSAGLVRLRATLLQSTATGERLLGQRLVVTQRAAPSADAPGGVRALTDASDAAVEELEQWLSQMR